jgi:WD40 repeat protein
MNMPDLKERLQGIDRLPVPDLWERARLTAPARSAPSDPSIARRVAIIAAALLISTAAIAFFWSAFEPQRTTSPVSPPPMTVENGDIWVQVGGGSYGATAIYRVDPRMQRIPKAMWTDSPSVFGGAQESPELISDDYAFSPDGSQVVFSAQTHEGGSDTPRELFIMNADGSGLQQLTDDGAYAGFPAWSPDGTTIAYASYRGTDYIPGCLGFSICPTDLYVIPTDGGATTLLVANGALSETMPTWSPDGTRLAFAELGENNAGVIVTIRTDGTGRVELSPGGKVSYPSWSPDGRWILFLNGEDGTNHIWIATPDDSGHHDIVDTRTDTNFGRPVWSPDGESIAFAKPYAGATSLWTIDSAGNQPAERVAGWPGYDAAPLAWQPVFVAEAAPGTPQPSTSPASSVVGPVKLGDAVRVDTGAPQSITSMVVAHGSVWAISQYQESGVEQLRRFDPRTGATEAAFSLPVHGGGEWGGDGLTTGAGYVWALARDSATVFRIDPSDNSVAEFSFSGRVVSALAFDQVSGEPWAAIAGNGSEGWRLVQLDPSNGTEISSTQYSTDFVGGLLPLQGTVWQLQRHVSGHDVMGGYLHQLSPGTVADVEIGGAFSLPTTDGRWIWTASSGDERVMNLASGIAQVDPSNGAIAASWDVGNVGYDIEVGEDGGIWFLGARGLERLDPTTGDVQTWDPTNGSKETPIFIVPTSDGVWVETYEGPLYFRPFV